MSSLFQMAAFLKADLICCILAKLQQCEQLPVQIPSPLGVEICRLVQTVVTHCPVGLAAVQKACGDPDTFANLSKTLWSSFRCPNHPTALDDTLLEKPNLPPCQCPLRLSAHSPWLQVCRQRSRHRVYLRRPITKMLHLCCVYESGSCRRKILYSMGNGADHGLETNDGCSS